MYYIYICICVCIYIIHMHIYNIYVYIGYGRECGEAARRALCLCYVFSVLNTHTNMHTYIHRYMHTYVVVRNGCECEEAANGGMCSDN
jgi:hypothetical protein